MIPRRLFLLASNIAVFCAYIIFFLPVYSYATSAADAVVKVFVTSNSIDYYQPWQSQGINSSVGSGSILSGNRILTNAHVVRDQTFIQVKKNSDPQKYTARVVSTGYDCDLALLTVDDPKFFENTPMLELGELPKLQDTVIVLGYPEGGDKMSITEGVVSRIEVTMYAQSARKLLTVQIDAAINPGNSGGPVLKDGKIVGVAMQGLVSGQNIGYMIPVPIIQHFFDDLKDGDYDGFPIIGVDFNTTENVALRKFYHLENQDGGVLVTRVLPYSSSDGNLKEGDIILAVDNVNIGEDGTFEFRDHERLVMPHLITQKQINDTIGIKVVRDGKTTDIPIKLAPFKTLIPQPKYFDKPPYYIYGGLVFTVLSLDLLQSWGARWWQDAPIDFTHYLIGSGRLNFGKHEEIVVLLNVLSDDVNIGYHEYNNEIIDKINGQDVVSFKEFIKILNRIKDEEPYVVFDTQQNTKIILDNKNIDTITSQILQRNNISRPYSQDVAGWLAK